MGFEEEYYQYLGEEPSLLYPIKGTSMNTTLAADVSLPHLAPLAEGVCRGLHGALLPALPYCSRWKQVTKHFPHYINWQVGFYFFI